MKFMKVIIPTVFKVQQVCLSFLKIEFNLKQTIILKSSSENINLEIQKSRTGTTEYESTILL